MGAGPLLFAQSDSLTVDTLMLIHPECSNANDGSIRFEVSGYDTSFTIKVRRESALVEESTWMEDTVTIGSLTAGAYSVSVIDNQGQEDTLLLTLEAPEFLTLSVFGSLDTTVCHGESTAPLSAVISTNVPEAYTFYISEGVETAIDDFSLDGGNYQLFAFSESKNCSSDTVEVTVNELPELMLDTLSGATVMPSCFGSNNGEVSLMAEGGTGSEFVFFVNNTLNADSNVVRNLSAGTYTFFAADSLGCQSNSIMTVLEEPDSLIVERQFANVSCDGEALGNINLAPEGGTPPYQNIWDDGNEALIRDSLSTGTYSYILTDANGCSSEGQITILDSLGTDVVVEPVSCHGQADGAIQIRTFGGRGKVSFEWEDGTKQSFLEGLAMGSYSFTVTDEGGCVITGDALVEEPPPLSVSLTEQPPCAGEPNGQLTAIANGGAPPYFYEWSNGADGSRADGLAAGSYSISLTDLNGCTDSADYSLQPFPEPQPLITVFSGSLPFIRSNFEERQIQLEARIENPGEVVISQTTWFNSFGTVLANGPFISIVPERSGTYTVEAISAEGCIGRDSLFIEVSTGAAVFVPSAFSPNNNGENDLFRPIYNPNTVRIESLTIKNRWGNTVYFSEGAEDWDGSSSGGEPQPTGSYVYSIQYTDLVENSAHRIVGQVTLIR